MEDCLAGDFRPSIGPAWEPRTQLSSLLLLSAVILLERLSLSLAVVVNFPLLLAQDNVG